MHARSNSTRGSRGPGHSYSNSVGQKAQLSLAYQELVKELSTTHVKTVGNYVLGRVIGEGSFGKVKLAVHKLTSQRCAVKQIPRSQAATLLTREIHHHRRLHHPNVVQLYEVIATEQSVWLISELCAGGELFDYLVEKGRVGELEARRMVGQLCLGVGYIHSQGVVHRDLKLENVLLDERCNIKIADFGFGREFEQRRLLETFCGTTGYAAPEMLARKKYSGEEVDVWSLGVIMYTLLTGSLPFDDDDEEIVKSKIIRCEYDIPSWLSEDARSLLAAILQLDPSKRPKIRQILAHDWFTRIMHGTPTTLHGTSALTPSQSRDRVPYLDSISGLRSDPNADPTASAAPGRLQTELHGDEAGLGISGFASQATLDDTSYGPDGDTRPWSETFTSNVSAQSLHTPSMQSALSDTLVQSNANGERSSSQRFPAISPSPLEPGSVSPAFPVPVHSRTPSRTKRRSIGSIMSERMATAVEALPDYLSLLSEDTSDGVSTALDRHLLDQLSVLGFDTGQIVHSVKTHACDTSSALWWIMKAKADQREADARDLDLHHADSMTPARSASMSSLAPSIATVSHTPAPGRVSPLSADRTLRSDGSKLLQPVVEVTDMMDPLAIAQEQDNSNQTLNQCEYGSAAAAHSPRQDRTMSTAAARLTSTSAPMLSISPAVGSGSARPKTADETLKSFTKNRPLSASTSSSQTNGHLPATTETDITLQSRTPTKGRSASVSAVSMLARAQSVLSSSRIGKDNVPYPVEASRPAMLNAPTAWFTRKPSGSNVQVEKPALLSRKSRELFQHKTLVPAPGSRESETEYSDSQLNSSIILSKASQPIDESSPVRKRQPQIPHDSPSGHSTTSVASQASETSTAVPSVVSSGSESSQQPNQGDIAGKKSQRLSKNLFTSFRTWFNDDRRRSRKMRDPIAELGLQRSLSNQSSSRRPVLHGPSPLKRPPIARLPSNGPTAVPSRRNSTASNGRFVGDDMSLQRRGTNESLTSAAIASGLNESGPGQADIDRTESLPRPPSAQSLSRLPLDNPPLHVRHRRAGSSSSVRSRSSMLVSGSPVANYRRTPAVTQVRRVAMASSMKRRPSHSRTHSNASSFRSAASSNDSGEDDVADIDEAIPEEEAELEKTDHAKAADTVAQPEKSHIAFSAAQVHGSSTEAVVTTPTLAPPIDMPVAIKAGQANIAFQDPSLSRGHHSRAASLADTGSHKNSALSGHSHHAHSRHQSLSALPVHAPTIFIAHKVVNPFGTPAGSHYTPTAAARRRTYSESAKPPLRDIFRAQKPADADGEWVDEDEFSKYSGGFGQSQEWLNKRTQEQEGGITAPASSPALCFGEKRYAGLSVPRSEAAGSLSSQRKAQNGVKASAFKRAAIVEEDEDED